MDDREAALALIKARITADRIIIGLASFKETPTDPAEFKDLPCVFMLEGVDRVTKYSSRSKTGYPAHRTLEVLIELVVNKKKSDVKAMFKLLRKTIFKTEASVPPVYNNVVTPTTFFVENRTEGPIGYGLPDIKVMRLVLDLIYIDGGF